LARRNSDSQLAREYVDKLRANAAVIGAEAGQVNSIALSLIDLGLFTEALEMLELGKMAAVNAAGPTSWSGPIYHLNRIQIKRHLREPLTPEDLAELSGIAASDEPLFQMGAAILSEKWEDAAALLNDACAGKNLRNVGQERDDWPILRLFPASLQNKKAREWLTKLFQGAWPPPVELAPPLPSSENAKS